MLMMRRLLVAVVAVVAAVGVLVVEGLDSRTIVGYVDSEAQFSVLAGLLRDAHLDLVLEAPGG